MMQLKCADLGMEGCDFVATGATTEEVVATVKAHGMEAHADKMSGMSDEEMTTMMTSKVTEVA